MPSTAGRALSVWWPIVVGWLLSAPAAAGAGLPWEIWEDLHRLPELSAGDQVLLRSSHCPTGCRFDRHAEDDWRYVYVDGEEGVIFEETGAGAITRIWMTMGEGVSRPLDPGIRLRVYVDGAEAPIVDLPLPALFDGSTPPFLPPLVGDRLDSSGGSFSYVPIPYRDGCRVTLIGAHEERIWFQLNFHRLDAPGEVVSFTGQEDLSAWAQLVGTQGESPWTDTSTWGTSTVEVAPGNARTLLSRTGSGSLAELLLDLAPESWDDLELRLAFDGGEQVRMPLADFFAIGRGGPLPTRSLFVGLDADDRLYSYFPMPFHTSLEVSLAHLGPAGAPKVTVGYQICGTPQAPSAASGTFGANLSTVEQTEIGVDFPFLDLRGQGKWVGVFAEIGSVGTPGRFYIEGDERIFIDGSPHPGVYGTGLEDVFNAGFGFDQGPFSKALHGSPYSALAVGGETVTAGYRFMPTDGVTFVHRILAGLEGGPTNDHSIRPRIVSYYYRKPNAALRRWDVLDLGDPESRLDHAYAASGSFSLETLDSRFEGEPPRALTATGVYRPAGRAEFVLRGHATSTRFRLRRRLDAGLPGQRAEIHVNGELAGRFPPVDVNADRRWREIDVDLAPVEPAEELTFAIVVPEAGARRGEETFTEFVYELWADADAEVFADGFESGDLSAWPESFP